MDADGPEMDVVDPAEVRATAVWWRLLRMTGERDLRSVSVAPGGGVAQRESPVPSADNNATRGDVVERETAAVLAGTPSAPGQDRGRRSRAAHASSAVILCNTTPDHPCEAGRAGSAVLSSASRRVACDQC